MLLNINDVCAMFATGLMKLNNNENTLYVDITRREMRNCLSEVVRCGGGIFLQCVKTFGNKVVDKCRSCDQNFKIELPPNFNALRMRFIVYNRFVDVDFRQETIEI